MRQITDRRVRMLYLEDEEDYIDAVRKDLDPKFYAVTAFQTLEEVQSALSEAFYHLLLIDIKLSEDADDEGGMDLLRMTLKPESALNQATELAVYSVHARTDWMREAFRDYRVADYIDKRPYKREKFIADVDKIVLRPQGRDNAKFHINLNLNVIWSWKPGGVGGASDAVTRLKFDWGRLLDEGLIVRYADEFDDLLCRLFADAESLVVERMNTGGFSGAGILRATPYFRNGGNAIPGRPIVLKFGDRSRIQAESVNYHQFVEPNQAAAYATQISREAYSVRLGVIAYTFVGTDEVASYDFDKFYTQATDEGSVVALIHDLFQRNFQNWYQNPTMPGPVDLGREYWDTLEIVKRFDEIRRYFEVVARGDELIFPSLSDAPHFVNPLSRMERMGKWLPVRRTITHGDLNERNILIDPTTHRPWVIDFATTADDKHMLRDFAQLDMSIRLELLRNGDATLTERLMMETELCRVTRFEQLEALPQRLLTHNPKLQKAYVSALSLRKLAYDKLGRDRQAKMDEYYIALFYQTLNGVRFQTFSTVQHEHAMLSCSLLSALLSS